MRIDYRYGAAVGILAAAFATLGPAAAQAGQTPGTSVLTCAGACGLEAPAVHITGIASRSIALTSTVERSSYSYGYDRYKFAFLGHRDRIVVKSNRCDENWSREGWLRACKSRHLSEFKDFKHVNPCKHVNYFDNSRHGDIGGYGDSGYGDSGYGHSGYGHSGYGHSGYGDSGYGHSGYGHSGYGDISLASHDSGLS